MKEITLAIIQFDADLKNKNLKGVVRFIDNIEVQYDNLLKNKKYKYDPPVFMKEIREVLHDIFTKKELNDMAREIHGTGETVQLFDMTVEVHLPLVKKIWEIRNKYDIGFMPQDHLRAFVDKYQDLYDNNNNTSVWAWYYFILHEAHPRLRFSYAPEGINAKMKEVAEDNGISYQNFKQTYYKIKSGEIPSYKIITEVVKLFEAEDDPEALGIAKEIKDKVERK